MLWEVLCMQLSTPFSLQVEHKSNFSHTKHLKLNPNNAFYSGFIARRQPSHVVPWCIRFLVICFSSSSSFPVRYRTSFHSTSFITKDAGHNFLLKIIGCRAQMLFIFERYILSRCLHLWIECLPLHCNFQLHSFYLVFLWMQ